MKKIALLSIATMLTFLISCSDKDSCEAADWAGTYSGTFDCLDNPQSVTVDIAEGSDENTVVVTIDGDSDVIELSGCSITMMDSDTFGEITLVMTLDGDNLKYNTSGNLLGIPFECDATLSK